MLKLFRHIIIIHTKCCHACMHGWMIINMLAYQSLWLLDHAKGLQRGWYYKTSIQFVVIATVTTSKLYHIEATIYITVQSILLYAILHDLLIYTDANIILYHYCMPSIYIMTRWWILYVQTSHSSHYNCTALSCCYDTHRRSRKSPQLYYRDIIYTPWQLLPTQLFYSLGGWL